MLAPSHGLAALLMRCAFVQYQIQPEDDGSSKDDSSDPEQTDDSDKTEELEKQLKALQELVEQLHPELLNILGEQRTPEANFFTTYPRHMVCSGIL